MEKPHIVVKLPRGSWYGKYFYTVEYALGHVTFTKKKDAEAFKRLLRHSTTQYQSDIVRREITDEGYML